MFDFLQLPYFANIVYSSLESAEWARLSAVKADSADDIAVNPILNHSFFCYGCKMVSGVLFLPSHHSFDVRLIVWWISI
jgi:hypothetical protein